VRRIAAFVVACAVVFGLWRCTDPFDRAADEPGAAISVFGPWLGSDADAFSTSVEGFTELTGIEVRYTGSGNFSTALRERLTRGEGSPDVAIVPQPGLTSDLIAGGSLVPLGEAARAAVAEHLPDAAADAPGSEGFAVPYRTIVKSLVWYRPDVFATHGWAIPDTMEQLHALVDEIQESAEIAPWCFGIFSGDDTGWPATDWVEDLLLRRAPPEVYDEWVAGARGFDDPVIRGAFDEFEELVLAPGRTAGGLDTILGAELRAIDDPLFAGEPGCAMYKQASFGTIWFPETAVIGTDVDFFVLPPGDPGEEAPLLRSGDVAVTFSDRPEVDDFMAYLASPDGAAEWAARGGYLSARSSVDPQTYYQPDDRRLAELILDDRDSRFDASDQFPSTIRDVFLDDITAWIAGVLSYDDLAGELDAARTP
jgi:alpha-glucoside transport system substrate-binding protein